MACIKEHADRGLSNRNSSPYRRLLKTVSACKTADIGETWTLIDETKHGLFAVGASSGVSPLKCRQRQKNVKANTGTPPEGTNRVSSAEPGGGNTGPVSLFDALNER